MTDLDSAQPHRRTLSYSRALLGLTVRENGAAMSTISRVFSAVAHALVDLEARCALLAEGGADPDALAAMRSDCRQAGSALRDGLRAVQIHDITDQRLDHVLGLLCAMAEGRPLDIAAVLTDDEERALLALIDNGMAIDEALARLGDGAPSHGSVELF